MLCVMPPQPAHQPLLAELPAVPTRRAPMVLRKPETRNIVTDKWVSKMFSIISSGPSGGFVRYMIDPHNRLVVDKTGNRSSLDDVVKELLPEKSCRYIAYNFRYRKGGCAYTKLVWFLWTPTSASEKEPAQYTDALANTLIGLNAQSSIPILKAATITDLALEAVIRQL